MLKSNPPAPSEVQVPHLRISFCLVHSHEHTDNWSLLIYNSGETLANSVGAWNKRVMSQDEPGARAPYLPQLCPGAQERCAAGCACSVQSQAAPDPVYHGLLTLTPLQASGVCLRLCRVQASPQSMQNQVGWNNVVSFSFNDTREGAPVPP